MKSRITFRILSVLCSTMIFLGGIIIQPISAQTDSPTVPIESFNAVTTVKALEQKALWTQFSDEVWSFEEKKLDKTEAVFKPTGDWYSPVIKKGDWSSADSDVRSAIPNMYYVWDGNGNTGRGLATYNNRVITFVGAACPAPTLTFNAPYTGTVKLYDPNALKVSGGSEQAPFWALDNNKEKIGFVIYKNNEKIWPADKDYYTLSQSENSIDFPVIDNLSVNSGDKIRMMFIPLDGNAWGYYALAPQIDYLTKSNINTSFNATKTVKAMESKTLWTEFKDDTWSFEEKKLDKTEAVFKPTGDWYSPVIKKGNWSSGNGDVRSAIPNMYYVWDGNGNTGRGLATYNGRVTTFVGQGAPAPTLTFTAPYTGTLKLHDPKNLKVGGATDGAPFWAINDANEKIGFVIYKNNEKIWPADKDYYTLSTSNKTVNFPEIDNLSVGSGDKIRMMFIPLNSSVWGYFSLAPQIDYQDVVPAYSAADSVKESVEAGSVSDESDWTYTAKHIKKDKEKNIYLPTGDWFKPILSIAKSDSNAVNSTFDNKQLLMSGSNSGLAFKNDKIYTYVGSSYNGVVGAVTFVAPYSGSIKLTDPKNIGIGTAGKGDPFYTLHDGGKKVGVAVYKNDEKIWPADEDYFTMTGDKWTAGVNNPGNVNIPMPDISDLRVEKGDNLRIAFIPLSNNWGYFALAPQIEYLQKDAVQPADKESIIYKSYADIASAIETGNIENSQWQLEKMACYPDEYGYNSASGKWLELNAEKKKFGNESIAKVYPDWLLEGNSSLGVTATKNATILSNGSIGADFAISLSFVAPYDGKATLSTPTGVKLGTAGMGNPFWSLNESGKIAGIAIYKNSEKLWPADKDYYRLEGQYDNSTGKYITDNEYETTFPTLKDIELKAGDRLRVCVIPIKGTWNFIKTAPEVEYTECDKNSVMPTQPKEDSVERYDAVDSVKAAMEKESLENSPWTLQAIRYTPSDYVNGEAEWGALYNEKMSLIYKPMSFSGTPFPFTWFNVPNTSVAFTVTSNNRLMLPAGSNTVNGYKVFPAIAFEVPKTGVLRLYGNENNPGISAAGKGDPYYTLKDTYDPDAGGSLKIVIYKNNKQIWPTENGEDNTITVQKRVIPFPDLELQVYKGDTLRIIGPQGGWSFMTMAPIAEYKSYNSIARPADDNPVWSYGNDKNDSIEWEDFPESESTENSVAAEETVEDLFDEIIEEIPEEVVEETNVDNGQAQQTVKKKIIKKYYQEGSGGKTYNWIWIVIICAAVIAVITGGIFITRKFILKAKK